MHLIISITCHAKQHGYWIFVPNIIRDALILPTQYSVNSMCIDLESEQSNYTYMFPLICDIHYLMKYLISRIDSS